MATLGLLLHLLVLLVVLEIIPHLAMVGI